ncbi:MAG: MerR family transcriptional regulator [Acidimicrobiia bacterium]|nr:MerR family transcriptional regulator [Acidimicrobiia bacterium]
MAKSAELAELEEAEDAAETAEAAETERTLQADAETGYRAPQVCKLVDITYRQLDYWARTDLIIPSVSSATGSGSQRLYSFGDIVQLKVVKSLLDAGLSLNKIRQAIKILREQLDADLSDVTLLSDGNTIFAAKSPSEVVDVLRRGQGVFAITVGPVQEKLAGQIHELFPDDPAAPVAKAT